jgi:hypothetical protein
MELPLHDTRGGQLIVTWCRTLDIVAPRRLATVRHAGRAVEGPSLLESLHLNELPMVPKQGADKNAS